MADAKISDLPSATPQSGDVVPFVRDGVTSKSAGFYHAQNILGTVSQSGGVPTGAIIQRGSNANGEFVRFADGTLICTHIINSDAGNTASGALYFATVPTWTFPSSFIVAPVVQGFVSAQPTAGGANSISVSRPTGTAISTTSASGILVWQQASSGTHVATVSLTAVGRWF